MAAGKWKVYESAKEFIGDGTVDLDSHSFKIALFLSTSNANTLSNSLLGDLTNQHSTANGYTAGGVALSGVTWTRSSGTVTFDASDLAPAWTASGGSITGRYLVIYDDTAASDPLICVCVADTTPADVTATDGIPFNITFHASGIFTLSGATSDA